MMRRRRLGEIAGACGVVMTLVAATAACGGSEECEDPAPCPAPPAEQEGLDIGSLVSGMENGGDGDASLPVPGMGNVSVSLECSSIDVMEQGGTTTVTMACTFDKLWVIGGDLTIVLTTNDDGEGSIAVTGTAEIPFEDDQDIDTTIELTGGEQDGLTITVGVNANGQCGTATITRSGDTLTISVDNPEANISIEK